MEQPTKKAYMRSTACSALLKTLLMLFNVLFLAVGIALFVVGVYGYKMFKQFFAFAPSTTIYIPIICIGLFMIVVGALSLWCIPKGVRYLLYVYAVVVFVLFLSIFTISVLFFARRDAIELTFKAGVVRLMNTYPNETASIDILQANIKCCGSENYTEWFEPKWANNTKKVPESCCMVKLNCTHENLEDNSNAADIYQIGCNEKFNETIENNYGKICAVLFASSFIVLLGCVLSFMLINVLKSNRYEQMR